MCYDISAQLKSQLKHAQRYAPHLVDEIKEKLAPYLDEDEQAQYRVSGFDHPRLIIYTDQKGLTPVISKWGLIPHWVKEPEKTIEISNKTLNARIETIHEKPSFKNVAQEQRCLVLIDGFFEHHHKNKEKIPHYIHKKDETSFLVGGLYDEWTDPNTQETTHSFTIVTTKATGFMQTLHNGVAEPRMPLILNENQSKLWLAGKEDFSINLSDFEHHEVRPIRGKNASPNTVIAQEHYPSQPDLFS